MMLKYFKTSNNDHFLHTYLKKKSPAAENSPKQKYSQRLTEVSSLGSSNVHVS
jgi:hypothetical protein